MSRQANLEIRLGQKYFCLNLFMFFTIYIYVVLILIYSAHLQQIYSDILNIKIIYKS